MTQSDPRGPVPPRVATPPPPPPVSGGARPADPCDDPRCNPPSVRWHRVEVVTTTPDGERRAYAAEGDDAWAAAALRSYADQIDPPRPAMRPAAPTPAGAARRPAPGEVPGSMVRRGGSVLPPPSDVPGRPDPMSTR